MCVSGWDTVNNAKPSQVAASLVKAAPQPGVTVKVSPSFNPMLRMKKLPDEVIEREKTNVFSDHFDEDAYAAVLRDRARHKSVRSGHRLNFEDIDKNVAPPTVKPLDGTELNWLDKEPYPQKAPPFGTVLPNRRVVHFDLKGAPPTVKYFLEVIPAIKSLGATSVLLEWEDMFPYTGKLEK